MSAGDIGKPSISAEEVERRAGLRPGALVPLESAIEQLEDDIREVAEDTRRWGQEESAQIYEAVAETATNRANEIREEMDE